MGDVRTVRLFVSSPGDVDAERLRVKFVAERLNGLFSEIVRFDVLRWEDKFYTADKSFQPQIPESTECDIVIGIFWARLGSELPPTFPRMPDGEPYPSGTAYELLSAIWKRQKLDSAGPDAKAEKLPDIYVFQKQAPPFPPPRDEKDLGLLDLQWKLLKGFIERWFRTRDGHFLAAFHAFSTTDDFEAQIEKLLREWIAKHVMAGRSVTWPIETKGSPFRGLDPFDAWHAQVFFGRSRDVTRATDRLRAAARLDIQTAPAAGGAATAAKPGTAFLLVVGASGAGKSSLVRAGLVPRLTTPGVVKEIDLWRIAIMRPSDEATPFDALAKALFARAAETSRDGGSPYTALPELAEGDHRTPAELASLLRSGAVAIHSIERALARIGESERARGNYGRPVRADLLLVVDQLDDLFAADVAEPDRAQFAKLLAALVATGRVWVVATLRAALYEPFLNESVFKALKDNGADYDLAPPGPAELAEIVRKPAEAAGLVFEQNSDGLTLDEMLLKDAAHPDTLPLLQFTLQRLFEARQQAGDETRLTFAAYDALGGLGGAIDRAAEDALKNLAAQEQNLLPRLLRELAVPLHDGNSTAPGRAAVTIRAVPLDAAAPDANARKLVNALIESRILTVETVGKVSTVSLAHQRVLESWQRAQEIVRSNADFYRVRGEIEDQRRRWQDRGRKTELLLPSGLPLAEAESIVSRYRDELNPELRAFVATSGKRARVRQRLTAIAAMMFALISVAAMYSWRQAYRALDDATTMISALVEATSETVQPNAQLDTVEALLELARKAINNFASWSDDPRIVQQRARTFLILAEIDLDRGHIDRMRVDAQAAFAGLDPLAKAGNLEARHLRAQAERLIGATNWESGNNEEAKLHFERGISDLAELLKRDVDPKISWRWMRSLAELYQALGDVLLFRFNNPKEALEAFNKCRDLRLQLIQLGHQGPALEHDLAWITNKRADVEERLGNIEAALNLFIEARDRMDGLKDRIWDNLRWATDFGTLHTNIARIKRKQNRYAEAVAIFARAEEILTAVNKRDPKNMDRAATLNWTRFLRAENLFRLGLQHNDRIRLLSAREQMQLVIATTVEIARAARLRTQAQLNKVREEAFLAAIDATLRQLNGNFESAAAGFIAATDIIGNGYLPDAPKMPWPDLLREDIEYLEWAGIASTKAQKTSEAQALFKRAMEMLVEYRSILETTVFEEFQKRIEARLSAEAPGR